jgi:AraC family transcriptional regulator
MDHAAVKLLPGRLYGDVLRNGTVAELSLVETAYAPRLNIPWHSHEHAYFCLVLRGTYTEAYGKRTRACDPFNLIFHPPGEVHSDLFHDAGGRCFNIQMSPRWLDRFPQRPAVLDNPAQFRGGLTASLALRLYKEFCEMDEVSTLAIEGLTLEILAEASRGHGRLSGHRPPRWLARAREMIGEHYCERLTLGRVAEQSGVHPVHLAREFRRFYRQTIGEYIRQLRVDFACREISTSDAPLAEIALAAGFSDQSQFSKTFKRLTGQAPTEYRKNLARAK